MAYQMTSDGIVATFAASGDLSGNQFCLVKLDANGRVEVTAATTDLPIGVLQNKPDALGKSASVLLAGVTKLKASAAIPLPNTIGCAAAGKAATQTGNSANPVIGHALTAAGADGEIFTASVNCLNTSRT